MLINYEAYTLLNMKVFLIFTSLLTILPWQGWAKEKEFFVHYMPWYEAKPHSPSWGYHWTMNHFNPDQKDKKGHRKVASHDYPLLEPYDSNDPAILECHVQWIKLAGIDGVIIDWYGIEDHFDYAMTHRNTQHLIKYIKKAGLKFIICYEDQTYPNTLKNNLITPDQAYPNGLKVMKWMDQNWFSDPSYFTIDSQPLLLVFGPQYFKENEWESFFSKLKHPPLLFGLPHLSKSSGTVGSFAWPPAHGGKEVPVSEWTDFLTHLYEKTNKGEAIIPAVFPGYRDIYKEAKLHESYGFIDSRKGVTLEETFDLALKCKSDIVQISTWNDYGEGTVVEPTTNRGYQYLSAIQKRLVPADEIKYRNLKLAFQIYQIKSKSEPTPELLSKLQYIQNLLYQGHFNNLQSLLDTMK